MTGLLQDVRYALRWLRKSPGFTFAVVLTLALGIGANVAIFSVVEAFFLRSWSAKDPRQLAQILAKTPQGTDNTCSYADYRDLAEQSKSLEGVLAYSRHGEFLRIGAETLLALDDVVSPNYFSVLEIEPQLGHTFDAGPRASGSTVIISDALWHRLFNADRALVGKQIWLTNRSYTVIGVAPPGFRGLAKGVFTDLWIPVTDENSPEQLADRNFRDFELLARLRPGATPAQAQVQLSVIGHRLAEQYPAVDKARDIILVSETERLREVALPTLVIMTTVGLVLLICCANVAGLILARSEARRREIAVRLAIGAGRLRLVRQLLTESTLLALAGAAIGLLLAVWLFRLQSALLPPVGVEVGVELRLNTLVLAFTAIISVLAAIAFGLLPALQSTKYGVVSALKGNERMGGRSVRRIVARNALVWGEIAVSVVLLTASGLLVRSLLFSRSINPGFDNQKNLIFFELTAGDERRQRLLYLNSVQERLAGLPGVTRASYAHRALLSGSGGGMAARVSISGVELPGGQPNIPIKFNAVSPEYFHTMGTRLLQGRSFLAADSSLGPHVVIVSETMARRFWPGQDSIGQHLLIEGQDCQIVGVAEDAKINHIHEDPEPYMYLPFAQWPGGDVTVIVETARDPKEITPILRNEILNLGPVMIISGVRTMHSLMQEAFWEDQIGAGFGAALSGLGMFLAALGLYGVIAYVVSRRQREIGIRMAMGAERGAVMRMVLGQGLRTAAIGTALGLIVSLGTMRLLSSMLYGVKPTDALSLFGSATIVILVAIAAAYFPARRAAKVDPMVALRYE
jgi:predicted permease